MKFVHLNHLCQTTFTELSTIMTLLVCATIILTAKVMRVTVMNMPVDILMKSRKVNNNLNVSELLLNDWIVNDYTR